MATEKQVYQFEIEAKNDKLRSSQRHKDGWRPLHTNHVNNQWEIIWNNDPDPPDPNKTENDRLKILQDKILDDSITQRELIEYERLKITLGR